MITETLPGIPVLIKIIIVPVAVYAFANTYRKIPQSSNKNRNFLYIVGAVTQAAVVVRFAARWMRSMWINGGRVEFITYEHNIIVCFVELVLFLLAVYVSIDYYITLREKIYETKERIY